MEQKFVKFLETLEMENAKGDPTGILVDFCFTRIFHLGVPIINRIVTRKFSNSLSG